MFIFLILLLIVFKTSCNGHSHWAGERRREGIPSPPTLISESNKIQQFLFQRSGIVLFTIVHK